MTDLTLAASPAIILRQPSTSLSPSPISPITPPTLSWLSGSWNVTHSTLPMWRKSRNVRITYTPIAPTSSAGGPSGLGGSHIDDEVSYQALDKSKNKISKIKGVDKPFSTPSVSAHEGEAAQSRTEELASLGYDWRGKGWLMVASSRWEILGYGDEVIPEDPVSSSRERNSWVVTYFASTLFTPAGVDFYSRKGQLAPVTVEEIKKSLAHLGGDVAKLAGEVFEVTYDGEREREV